MSSDVVTQVGLLLTFIGLVYTAEQIRRGRKVAQGEFLLRLDELFQSHNDVHEKLRPGGEWAKENAGPSTPDEWVKVELYMGLFERVQILIEDGIIRRKIFERLYGYRVGNIVKNQRIKVEKLEKRSEGWKDFIALAHSLGYL